MLITRLFRRAISAGPDWGRRSGRRILRGGTSWRGRCVGHGSPAKEQGPTFNAYLNGAGYWTKYGAADVEKDRFATRFGPSELSQSHPHARLDITAVLNDPKFGADLGSRLRLIEENGLLLKKLETYDVPLSRRLAMLMSGRYRRAGMDWRSKIRD